MTVHPNDLILPWLHLQSTFTGTGGSTYPSAETQPGPQQALPFETRWSGQAEGLPVPSESFPKPKAAEHVCCLNLQGHPESGLGPARVGFRDVLSLICNKTHNLLSVSPGHKELLIPLPVTARAPQSPPETRTWMHKLQLGTTVDSNMKTL